MGVGFYLTGTFPGEAVGQTPVDWLEQVAAWLESHEEEPLMLCRLGQNGHDEPTLYVQVHPCAEEVEFSVPAPNVCLIVAKTSTVGPGYHIFLCDLLQAFGTHLNITWDDPDEDNGAGDETGYFHTRDTAGVRREMVRWLSALSRVVIENCKDDTNIRMVSMPLDYSYPDEKGILTPIGSRSPQWFEQMIETPERGLDFFPWWPEGVGSAFFLGRAASRLWQEVRWRAPITEEEGELLMDVHLDLERAYHLDPSADIPWREWHELLGYLNEYFGYAEFQHEEEELEAEIERRAESADPSARLIGFRRGRVQVTLTGGWSIVIPGDYAEQWEENGETWSAWHGGRTIWFTSWSVKGEADEGLSPRDILDSRPWPEGGERFDHADGALLGQAVFLPYEDEGEPMWNLKGYTAIDGNFALCNIYLHDQSDLAWALEVWKSLRN